MGSGESSSRKVSFGVDEEDRVRILRGVKLSEDVLQRMRGVANQAPEPKTQAPPSPQKDPGPLPSPQPQTPSPLPQTPPPTPSPQTPITSSTEDLKKSYEWQQSVIQEELSRVARREREAARMEMSRALHRERLASQQLSDRADILAQRLQKKDAELTALDAFYKEQLAQLEKRNQERYAQAGQQFHQAADKAQAHIRSRSTEAVCSGLQAQILSCYRENREQTLLCSDLAKQYLQCISAANKDLLVNHG